MRITLLGTGTPTLDQNRKGSSLLIEVGNEKLVLTHITPKSENMMKSLIEDVRRDYDGEICLGKDLMVINL